MSDTTVTEEEKKIDYAINYDDERFKKVESDKNNAISEVEKTYSGMIDESDSFYQSQIDASKEWEKEQTDLQNQKTDFAIQEIEQQKDQAKKDYTKEQSGAYVDWQKQSNEFGAEAEQRATQGLENTGFSESSKVSMFNTYQNRIATARESFSRAVLNFDNAITEARLQNNSALAEIAYNAFKEQSELSLQGFQYKNQLLTDLADRKLEIDQIYHERWQDVLDQINTDHALAEEIRQFNESMDWEKYQFNFKNKLGEFAVTSSGGGGGGGSSSSSGGGSKSSSKINKSSGKSDSGSSSGGLPSDTRDSILALGQGPISATNLANQVNSGKVTTSTNKKTGNTIFSYAGLKKY